MAELDTTTKITIQLSPRQAWLVQAAIERETEARRTAERRVRDGGRPDIAEKMADRRRALEHVGQILGCELYEYRRI
jgi:hypothetical protein